MTHNAIQRRIHRCLDACEQDDWESALVHLWPAIDATARLRRPDENGVGNRIQGFLRDETLLILAASGSSVVARNVTVGGVDLATALYKFCRNAITHEGQVASNMTFRAGPAVHIGAGRWNLPFSYVLAMALAVILSPENRHVSDSSGRTMDVQGQKFRLEELWGQPELIFDCLRKVFGDGALFREAT
jgi:hypothetical protein